MRPGESPLNACGRSWARCRDSLTTDRSGKEPANQRELVEKLAEEFVERYRRGERPSLEEYTAAYPEHAEEIRQVFPALVMIEELAPGEDSSAATGPQAVVAQASLNFHATGFA